MCIHSSRIHSCTHRIPGTTAHCFHFKIAIQLREDGLDPNGEIVQGLRRVCRAVTTRKKNEKNYPCPDCWKRQCEAPGVGRVRREVMGEGGVEGRVAEVDWEEEGESGEEHVGGEEMDVDWNEEMGIDWEEEVVDEDKRGYDDKGKRREESGAERREQDKGREVMSIDNDEEMVAEERKGNDENDQKILGNFEFLHTYRSWFSSTV